MKRALGFGLAGVVLALAATVAAAGPSVTGSGTTRPSLTATANVTANNMNAQKVVVGAASGSEAYPGIWFGSATPSISNFNFLYDSGGPTTILNVASGGTIEFRVANGTIASLTGSGMRQHRRTGTAPTAPAACASALEGVTVFVDDTNDGAAAFLCFCGKGADDTTYSWQKAASPGTSCGPF